MGIVDVLKIILPWPIEKKIDKINLGYHTAVSIESSKLGPFTSLNTRVVSG